jgi:hypothetical protein
MLSTPPNLLPSDEPPIRLEDLEFEEPSNLGDDEDASDDDHS